MLKGDAETMSVSDSKRMLREKSLLTQEAFAKELGVPLLQ